MRFQAMKGYTLIELLIVIFIISIVSGVAMLSIGRNENNKLEAFTNELVQTITLAQEQALLQPAVFGLRLDQNNYQFLIYQPSPDSKKNVWFETNDKLLNKHKIPSGVQVVTKISGYKEDEDVASSQPQIVISTNGDITPFKVYIGKAGESPRFLIQGEADGNVTSKTLS